MRERKRIKPRKTDMPISSMIDVVFLLLIYFLVVQKPIIEETFLKAELPDPTRGKSTIPNPEFLKIDVIKDTKDNARFYYAMNGRVWQDDLLFAQLQKVAATNNRIPIVINCGPNARHHKLVTLLDVCAEAELTNINIVNDESIPFTGK